MGYAPTFAAMAGLPHITGYEDSPPSNFMGSIDLRSATMSAFAILTALIHHQNTGEGQYIDLSSQEVIAALCGDVFLDYIFNNQSPERSGNKDKFMAPHNCYRCSGYDNWISIVVGNNAEWQGLCDAMEKPELAEDKRFSCAENRLRHLDELDRIISDWTCDQDYYIVMEKLQNKGVAAAPSMSGEALFKDPHLKARGVYQQVEHPVIGKDWIIAPPWRLSETPAQIKRCSPLLGEHNEEILCGLLKMNPDEVRRLTKEKIVY
ncbi:MAG: CoA transferase [Proteobacteria bacterium]|nr:CoA transferase [Pseudomonadota bacterium]